MMPNLSVVMSIFKSSMSSSFTHSHHINQAAPTMKISPRLLANPTAVGSTKGLKPAPLALLPPITLYRRLLRSHRKYLPKEMRVLGDEYIKSEFHAHRNVENPMHIVRQSQEALWRNS